MGSSRCSISQCQGKEERKGWKKNYTNESKINTAYNLFCLYSDVRLFCDSTRLESFICTAIFSTPVTKHAIEVTLSRQKHTRR